jgi:hypothetical protein
MKNRYQILWILPAIVVAWLLWPKRDSGSGGDAGSEPAAAIVDGAGASEEDESSGSRSSSGRDRQPDKPSATAEQDHSSTDVDQIISDQSITDDEAARRLRGIVENPSLPLTTRMEALQHGVTLSLPTFTGLAEKQPDLPVELAEIFLPEVLNWNDSPADQVRTYLAWMDHPDQEIAAQSLESLRFMLADDEEKESPERLKQLAQEKIKELLAQPQQE